ncbi:hypothetical protein BOX37_31045 [Nocardia mangyaensis]|uniref:Uncharacterized protein n=1 Tax=Nocardia mangyaensis TaxID=2213200 RepID=A0A1J0W001_9NOCA|nr:hypothetical protein [Nocardia mangyaensis]APE37635.1 hypothetical protein BOX37_31045 [Nocardia mangyaensis]MDO3649301.1 hypothetical protein [Nocardia mangyaensis]
MEARTVDDWVSCYQREFGLPVRERGGFVMLPITDRICVVHLPTTRAEKVLAVLREQRREGPVLARQIRWSLLAVPDARPPADVATDLSGLDIDIPAVGSAVMLPTSLGRWSREGCHWVRPPAGHDALPPLSLLLHLALSVVPQRVSTALSESGESGKFRYDRDGVGPR